LDTASRARYQQGDAVVALAALVDLVEAVVERADERVAALARGEEVVFQVGVATYHPDVAEDLVQHPRRAAGDTFGAELVEHRPGLGSEQADDDLAVGKRGVVVRNLAQALAHWTTRKRLQGSGPF
jgi:hypothetical protein